MRTPQLVAAVIVATWTLALPYAGAEDAREPNLIVFGRVVWPGLAWFPRGAVSAARDLRFTEVVATAPISPEGRFILALPAGDYYLRAVVDVNADGKVSRGDGIGFYGVTSPKNRPRLLSVQPDAPMEQVVVHVVFQLDDNGKLRQAVRGASAGCGRIVGKVDSAGPNDFLVLWGTASRYAGFAAPLGTDGAFNIHVEAGVYWLAVAHVDNAHRRIEAVHLLANPNKPGEAFRAQVLPQSVSKLGTLRVCDDDAANKTAIPSGMGLARLEIAAGAGKVNAWRVMLFATQDLDGLMLRTWLWKGMWLALRPATYYILCGADLNADGVLGPGDALATTNGSGRLGFVSVAHSEIVHTSVDRVAEVMQQKVPPAQEKH